MLAETSKFNLNLDNILNITKNNLCRSYMFLYCENFKHKVFLKNIFFVQILLYSLYNAQTFFLF